MGLFRRCDGYLGFVQKAPGVLEVRWRPRRALGVDFRAYRSFFVFLFFLVIKYIQS